LALVQSVWGDILCKYVFYGNKINPLPRKLFSLYYEVGVRQHLKFTYDSSGYYVIKGKTIHNYNCRLEFAETEKGYSVSIDEFTVYTKKYKYMVETFHRVEEFYKRNPKYNALIFAPSKKSRNVLFKNCFPMVVFDTERNDNNIIQFGGQMVDIIDNQIEVVDELNLYIQLPKSSNHIRKIISEMTKIDKKLLKEIGLTQKEASMIIADFMKRARCVCGQSIHEDVRCLNIMFGRNFVKSPTCMNHLIDVAVLYQYLNNTSSLLALEKEAADYNLEIVEENLHNAYFDAILARKVMECVIPEFIEKFHTSPILKAYQLEGKNRIDDLRSLRFTKGR